MAPHFNPSNATFPLQKNEGEKVTPVTAQIPVSAESFQLLVDGVSDYGIFMLSPAGIISSWNLGAQRLKGYNAREVIGKHFSIFYPQADRDRGHPQEELNLALKNGRYEEDGWRLRKDGTKFWANIVITPVKQAEGKLLGFSKVTRDLTERKAAEDALRASEEQARLVYQSVKDYAIISLDINGCVTGWNEGARRIKGYEAHEILGKYFSIFYEPEEIATGKCEYELKEAAFTGNFEDEGWRIRKDGTKFWANVIITALYDKMRRLRGYSKVTRDITERKRAEDRLKLANEGMERRVQERTQALTAANEKLLNEVNERKKTEMALQQAVRARDEFLSVASHELRTPITPVKLQLQALLAHFRNGSLPNLSPERIEKMVVTIDRSLNRLGKLIDNLLDVARINAGKIELHPEELEVGDVVNDTCSRFQHEAVSAGSELTVESHSVVISALLDRTRLEQVITNLIVNAIKYGISKPITVSFAKQDSKLIIRVSDRGVGISADNFTRIFEKFEQVDKQYGSGGLGLGLYITKQIVDAQGGTIRVESIIGAGSTFVVELPLA